MADITKAAAPDWHARGGVRRSTRAWRVRTSAVLVAAVVLAVLVVPPLVNLDEQAVDLGMKLRPPSLAHPFGTDDVGRDLLLRCVYGLRVSLLVGVVAAVVATVIGTAVGALAAASGGWVDRVVMRLVDVFSSVPHLLLGIFIVAMFRPGVWPVVVSVALTHWLSTARIVRAEVLSLRSRPYVDAAISGGASRLRVAVRHLLPGVLPQAGLAAVLMVPHAIWHESALSFLGLGLPTHQASLGTLVQTRARLAPRGRLVADPLPRPVHHRPHPGDRGPRGRLAGADQPPAPIGADAVKPVLSVQGPLRTVPPSRAASPCPPTRRRENAAGGTRGPGRSRRPTRTTTTSTPGRSSTPSTTGSPVSRPTSTSSTDSSSSPTTPWTSTRAAPWSPSIWSRSRPASAPTTGRCTGDTTAPSSSSSTSRPRARRPTPSSTAICGPTAACSPRTRTARCAPPRLRPSSPVTARRAARWRPSRCGTPSTTGASPTSTPAPASLIPLISDNWSLNFTWQGTGPIPPAERDKLRGIVFAAHARGQRVRFWATPDLPGPRRDAVWGELLAAGVDHLNTDDLAGLEAFLDARGR
ncbi:hypothetical protein SALBM135S_07262 [Streptomyces alboniger]